MSITLIIIIITAVISVMAFNNGQLMEKLIFYPAGMKSPSEYYRFISSGFIHADWMHLLFNMYVLYIFGRQVEYVYAAYIGQPILYLILYVFAVIAAGLPSYAKHKDNYYYRALGASGAVAAVMFSYVYYAPWATLLFWFIPMPSIVFAVGYLVYSAYAAKKANDNIGHDAHFYGAIFGFVFTLVFDPSHGMTFLEKILHPNFNF